MRLYKYECNIINGESRLTNIDKIAGANKISNEYLLYNKLDLFYKTSLINVPYPNYFFGDSYKNIVFPYKLNKKQILKLKGLKWKFTNTFLLTKKH